MAALNDAQKASRDQFQKQSARYGKSHILANVEDVAALLDGVSFPAGARALDVATGGGHTALYLAGRGLSVTASDITPAMLENTAKLAAERGLSIETVLHEAERFPYQDAAFDVVTCRVAAHHFSDPRQFVAEAVRVLKPGGYLMVIDGSVPDGEPEAEEWLHQVEKLRDPSHGRFIAPAVWARWVRESGLELVECATTPFKQPDLEWYFQTAATSEENRARVMALVESAPESVRRAFRLAVEDGKVVWWWPRLGLLARKP
ncbi:methyltransferase domain-containing protein [Terrimicrobium sacchariphilum]|uniref:Methyltransferase domain-containing protein n=1 Tax=Terrimicrobium sacchariphilum TaxID=690879 RepID=A0A146G8X9_TERSA|nr:class I SAM-dependent methyltransferase [Terrimicrobium sacchariphilum]GAT33743.1 methyltransferase domain-containing protein [Terrimicrobium sacchariphilum]